jgi:hypothetical protein
MHINRDMPELSCSGARHMWLIAHGDVADRITAIIMITRSVSAPEKPSVEKHHIQELT